ncbi:hypothetical protein SCLCIDRAFT_549507 [Scleroderma citrinum Foug A]|uniref:Uncharacterized protein n=1 Tax=Scleroderma citrinum Foug A TaxID=1036808 RepID=A0A0C3CVG6_9AGAM|nr:hypothetical protein SCLCIDRAFT_549507 [Scleroderma citrinum Foug A]
MNLAGELRWKWINLHPLQLFGDFGLTVIATSQSFRTTRFQQIRTYCSSVHSSAFSTRTVTNVGNKTTGSPLSGKSRLGSVSDLSLNILHQHLCRH